ncbi:MAG: hypothetical protein LBP37_03090 [Spirochaetaceae bacterium]|jgi:hypothetical protein|nr:hypothetical protein [Spirochaetaceae bacterium]
METIQTMPEWRATAELEKTLGDETNRVRTGIDILLSDTGKLMAVEVKHELDKEKYVEEHLKRMELLRECPPVLVDMRDKQLIGALAGGVLRA